MVIFFAVAAEQLDVANRTGNQRHRPLLSSAQGIGPEMGVEFAVAEVICLFYKHMKQGELLDYLPEFCCQFLIRERIRVGVTRPRSQVAGSWSSTALLRSPPHVSRILLPPRLVVVGAASIWPPQSSSARVSNFDVSSGFSFSGRPQLYVFHLLPPGALTTVSRLLKVRAKSYTGWAGILLSGGQDELSPPRFWYSRVEWQQRRGQTDHHPDRRGQSGPGAWPCAQGGRIQD